MPVAAFFIVLGSAVLHASWNLIVKASSDRLLMSWMQVTFGALVFLPFLIVGGLPAGRLDSVAMSSTVHLLYGLTLVAAYDRGDLSVVYPIARGMAPVLVALGAFLILDDRPGVVGLIAMGLIVAGVVGVAGWRGRGVPWALLTAGLISVYTLIDGAAARQGGEALRYTVAVMCGDAILFLLVVLVRRGRARMMNALRTEGWRSVAGGTASVSAYILVLVAAISAPLGLVASVRETSVVFGALGGWLLLKEPFGPTRVRSAVVIAVGLVLLVV